MPFLKNHTGFRNVWHIYKASVVILLTLWGVQATLLHRYLPKFQFTDKGNHKWLSGRIQYDSSTFHGTDGNEFEWYSDSDIDGKIQEFRFSGIYLLRITEQDTANNDLMQNYMMELIPEMPHYTPEICLSLDGAFWYGGAELHTQRWPLNDVSLPMQPFVTNDIVPLNQSFGNVIERLWVNSKGVGIFVDEKTPLYVSFNDKNSSEICLKAEFTHPFPGITNKGKLIPELKFTVAKAKTITDVHCMLAKKHIKLPSGMPDYRMIKSPIWSTWAKYKIHIDEEKILGYADEILQHGFSNSQIEIDDMFSTHYGEFNFSPKKFKNPVSMVQALKEKGFRVTVWITPFANLDSLAFEVGMNNSYWLTDSSGNVPALVKWWQGVGGTLDVTNEDAVNWFLDRLSKMKTDYGIDSFKFDAGEMTYLPSSYKVTEAWHNDPCTYTTRYVDAVIRMGPMIEVRCGYRTQQHPVFVRMGDKESRWGYDNGLQTLIPTVLTFGILGYPYILPDMIGGNGYVYTEESDNPSFSAGTVLPDRELYIRWLELTAYLPAMQFSIVPWQYDEEVVKIAQKYVQLHEHTVTPLLIEAAKVTQLTGAPLIRPLWWMAPEDIDALECDSEFLVGRSLLVAPVLKQGATTRDVYLPTGIWEDHLTGKTVNGGTWLYRYKAELDQIPTFKLLN